MNKRDAIEIINDENLVLYNFFENRNNVENEVAIQKKGEVWVVYATDERASIVTGSEKEFDCESGALENFVKRLRAMNFLRKSL